MKENYTVSFVKNDVNQCRLVKAESKEQALAYFAEIEPDAEICGAALDQCNLERRGCPVEIVPDGWTPAPAEAETADKPADILAAASAAIEKAPARSAWARGVKAYALELLDNLEELTADKLADPAAVRAALFPSVSAVTAVNAAPIAAKNGWTSRLAHSRRRRGSSARL